jgi:hypothetical protein
MQWDFDGNVENQVTRAGKRIDTQSTTWGFRSAKRHRLPTKTPSVRSTALVTGPSGLPERWQST